MVDQFSGNERVVFQSLDSGPECLNPDCSMPPTAKYNPYCSSSCKTGTA